jgi:excisionase family DNA binding protein
MSSPPTTPPADIDRARLLYSVRETQMLLSVSRPQIYRLLGGGRLHAKKIGSRTLVTAESIKGFLATLPSAQVRSAS